ncbi:MAG: hypothetical protein NTY64_01060 [Deltaproteobacteria bacterium]|nr:hypothetical protein [Deltaproteobacteria bacterium]
MKGKGGASEQGIVPAAPGRRPADRSWVRIGLSNGDGFVKSPSAALRFTFVAAAYHPSTPCMLKEGSYP